MKKQQSKPGVSRRNSKPSQPSHTFRTPSRQPGDPNSAGQSGDTQGISGIADADSESVEELLEEGQSFEAEAILGIENAPPPDVAEVRTRQVREDDVPAEYIEREDKP